MSGPAVSGLPKCSVIQGGCRVVSVPRPSEVPKHLKGAKGIPRLANTLLAAQAAISWVIILFCLNAHQGHALRALMLTAASIFPPVMRHVARRCILSYDVMP